MKEQIWVIVQQQDKNKKKAVFFYTELCVLLEKNGLSTQYQADEFLSKSISLWSKMIKLQDRMHLLLYIWSSLLNKTAFITETVRE